MEDFYRAESVDQPAKFYSMISCAYEPRAARAAQRLKLVSKTTSRRIDSCLRRRRRERLAAQEEGEYWSPAFFDHDFVFKSGGILAFGDKDDAAEYSNKFYEELKIVKYLSDDFEYSGTEADTGLDMYLLGDFRRVG